MSFKTTILTALQKVSNSYRKDRRNTVLLEPPFRALPITPGREDVYYVIDDLSNMTMTTDVYDADVDKTYYESMSLCLQPVHVSTHPIMIIDPHSYFSNASENETFYEAEPSRTPLRRSTKRKHSSIMAQPEVPLEPLLTSTPHSFDAIEEFAYSPPAKRAPILRRIPLKLDIPLQHPPAIPEKEDEEKETCSKPMCHRIKSDFIITLVSKATDS